MFFSFFAVFLSNVSNFFPIVPNIPDQTSYHPIYTMSLLYTSLVTLLYETLYDLLFLPILTPLYILLQTFLLGPLYSLSSPLVPKYLLLLYIPSIAPDIYPSYHKWSLTNLWLVNLNIKKLKKVKLDKQQKMLLSLKFIPRHKYIIVVVCVLGQTTTWSLPIFLCIEVLLFLK